MAWQLYRWVWQLGSPLHVGMPSAGNLNRTRLYVPARAVWGAVAAELARRRAEGFPEYSRWGERLRKEARFSYLYPAQKDGGEWYAWLPRYRAGRGLVWHREDRPDGGYSDREMRRRLLGTRAGMAIEPAADAALESTLRETEHINTCWRLCERSGDPVGMAGYIAVRSESAELVDLLKSLETIFVGGDTRYGFGRLERAFWAEARDVFGKPFEGQGEEPTVKSEAVFAHADAGAVELKGDHEVVAGWDHDRLWTASGRASPLWLPGSCLSSESPEESILWLIQEDGIWYRARRAE